ncbi:amino acid adenylation domain-containing protein [Lentzea waywayandensis]|uniref:Amino acid adenylation domain-containing protein n=1 Tax=Lentzea waywayandensis TaxID=84724 RepID=A0A1I6FFK5_9PSEU|nr:amino acid adenylation domain-containing protein [Lentzea waywayandensis]SFR28726.1 amino acid adenylation domain-containing protein [Lentzea waywayandensis]
MYSVVTNAHKHFSLWPDRLPIPGGWQATGFTGDSDACIDEIAARWDALPSAAPQGGDTLVELFRDAVERHGGREAVSDSAGVLTYRELDALSDGVARDLREIGVGHEDRVVLYLGRGVRVFAALLGVLKAGAAYVPVDTRYPESRRDLMISASGAEVVVTDVSHAEAVAGHKILVMDEVAPGPRPAVEVGGGDAAAVLFTSGSSGTPKAIVLEHRGLVHFARNPALPPLLPTDRVGHVSSLSFDAFHFETWCAFAGGARIVVLPTMPDLLGGDVHRELRRNRITAMLVPTMAVNHVVREDIDAFASLRVLHTGGDVLSPSACRELLSGSFEGEFYNLYGPTEGTTAVTAHRVDADPADTVPIGLPLTGSAVYVLSDLAEVAPGEVGELHIGGPGVARGYLGRPALTAQRFLPDPFAGDGSRMYATGDLARRRPDGVLEFVGRADDQVKIRGYRVEPLEAERIVASHPDVRDAAVLVSGEGQDKHLVALVVPYDRISPKELRQHAAERMPDFMVPTSFVSVPEIPATDHGKRDVGKLRELVVKHAGRAAHRVGPRDDVERRIAEIWEDLLAVEDIGVADDFFTLGGNSLLAFRVQRRIGKDLGVPLQPRDVLANSELAGLAALVRSRMEELTA